MFVGCVLLHVFRLLSFSGLVVLRRFGSFAGFRLVASSCAGLLLGLVSLSQVLPVLGIISPSFFLAAFGRGLPVVFSGSFSDPLRLLLFLWFDDTRRRCRSGLRSPRRVYAVIICRCKACRLL